MSKCKHCPDEATTGYKTCEKCREKHRINYRQYRHTHPEYMAAIYAKRKATGADRRRLERIRSDPARLAAHREKRRVLMAAWRTRKKAQSTV